MAKPLQQFGSRLATLYRLDPELRPLLIEAAWRLLALKALFSLLPFGQQRRFFGQAIKPDEGEAYNHANPLNKDELRLARQIGWAVWRAELHLPVNVACLPMALVARKMLRQHGIEGIMTFGAEQDGPAHEVGTHAWLVAGEAKVSGFPHARRCSPFVSFLLT